MYDSIETLEYTDILLSIEEIKLELDNNYRVINDGIRAANLIDNMVKINKLSLENNNLNTDLFKLTLDTLNIGLESIGCKELSIVDSISVEDNINNTITSMEGLAGDIWLVISKIFEKMMGIFAKYYQAVRNFFKLNDIRIEKIKKKLNDAPDLNDFDIDSKSLENFTIYCRDRLPVFSALGYDILNKTNLDAYTDSIIGNDWLFDNTDIIFKGLNTPDKTIRFPSKFNIIKPAFKDMFNNLDGATNKRNEENINSIYVAAIKTNSIVTMSLVKNGEVIEISHVESKVDVKYLDSKYKKQLSKLNKTKVIDIIKDLDNLRTKEEEVIKSHTNFMSKVKLEYKSLIDKESIKEGQVTSNINNAGNISTSIMKSMTDHVHTYTNIAEKLVDIYVNSSKKTK